MAINDLSIINFVGYILKIAINWVILENISSNKSVCYHTLLMNSKKLTRKFNTNWRDCSFEISISSTDGASSMGIVRIEVCSIFKVCTFLLLSRSRRTEKKQLFYISHSSYHRWKCVIHSFDFIKHNIYNRHKCEIGQ